MPEIAGEALLIDALNEDQIGQAIETILTNPNLSKQMSKKGLERAAMFS